MAQTPEERKAKKSAAAKLRRLQDLEGARAKGRAAQARFTAAHPKQVRASVRKWRTAHPEQAREATRRWEEAHPEEVRELWRRPYKKNPKKVLEKNKRWAKTHPKAVRAIRERYEATHAEEKREKTAQYGIEHPEQRRVIKLRYRARKHALPDTFTVEDHKFMLEHWNFSCAVCGRQEGAKLTLANDHWIPLRQEGCHGTVPTNMLPLCHGIGGCNNSKQGKDPHAWLIQRFGENQTALIEESIFIYFILIHLRKIQAS